MIDWTIEQIRRTAAQMAADNPELSAGQLAVESDARMAKVGPGRYSELPYMIDIDMVKADAAWETDQRDGEGSSSGSINLSVTPFLYLTSGSSKNIYHYQGEHEGKPWYVKIGETATTENPIWSVIWTDNGSGLKWYVLDGSAEVLYFSAQDTATPDLVTAWTADTGAAPLPSIALYPGPTVQDALEQLAAEVSSPSMYRALLTQSSTDAPSLTVLLNELGGSPVASYVSPGVYRITLSGAFDPDKTLAIISNNTGDGAAISIVSARVDASGNYIEIVTGTGQDDIDEILNKTPLLIEVYP